ncbi:MAG: oligosaccharide flippase family protein [Planctomycetota bacterium]
MALSSESSEQPSQSDATNGVSFRRHGLWALAGRLLNIAVVASSSFVLARIMPTKADFGTFTFLQSVVTLCGIVAGIGSGTVAIRWAAEANHRGQSPSRDLRVIAATLGVAAVLTGLSSAIGLSWWSGSGQSLLLSPTMLMIVGVAIAFRGSHQFFAGAARGHTRLKTANLLDGANGSPISNGFTLLAFCLASLAVVGTWEVATTSLALANVIAALTGMWLLRDLLFAHQGRRQRDDDAFKRLLAIGIPVAATSLIVFLVEQLDVLYAGAFLSDEELADYSAAKRFSLLLRMPFAMVNMAVTGVISNYYIAGKKQELQRILSGTAVIAFACSLCASLPILLLPATMLELGYGEGYSAAATTLLILVAGQLIMVVGGSCQQALILTEFQGVAMKVNLSAALVFCGLLISVPGIGPERVAICFTLTTAIRAGVMWWMALRHLEINTAPTRIGAAWAVSQLRSVPVLKKLFRAKNESSGKS